MKNKVKLLLVSRLMTAGMSVACAHVQFKVDQSKIGPDGGIVSYAVSVFDKNDQLLSDGVSPTSLPKTGMIKLLDLNLPTINQDFSTYGDGISSGKFQSTFDMQLPTTAGAIKCHFNAQQLKSASVSNETFTLPNATYCSQG